MSPRNHAGSDRAGRLARKLSSYVAGGAALVAVDANAAIIYTDLGPGGMPLAGLDLNDDGANEFEFRTEFTSWTFGCSTTSSGSTNCGTSNGGGHTTSYLLQGVGGNRVLLHDNLREVRALERGESISIQRAAGGSGYLVNYSTVFAANDGNCEFGGCQYYNGDFLDGRRAFVGLLFDLPTGGPIAGWADIQMDVDNFGSFTLYGYAYETEGGKEIAAGAVPEPPSLVLLAAGAAGLAVLGRKRATRELF